MAHAIVMPSYGMYTAEGTLVRWLKPSGEQISAGEVIAEIETEKAVAEVTAPATGLLHHVAAPGDQLQVESLIGYVLAPGETPPEAPPPIPAAVGSSATPPPAPLEAPTGDRSYASPNARRLAREFGVDLGELSRTGPGGRITEEDVRAAAEDALR